MPTLAQMLYAAFVSGPPVGPKYKTLGEPSRFVATKNSGVRAHPVFRGQWTIRSKYAGARASVPGHLRRGGLKLSGKNMLKSD